MELITSVPLVLLLLLCTIIFLAIWGIAGYALRNSKSAKAEREARDAELEDLIQEIANCKEEARLLLIDCKRERDKVVELEKSNSVEKEDLNNTVEELKLKLTGYQAKEKLAELKPKPKPRVDRYNNPNTLYIAYDFNMSGNQSYAKVRKHILDATSYAVRPAIKTTSIIFFNRFCLPAFKDVILVKKNGATISINKLYNNPEYYIKESKLLDVVKIDKSVFFSPDSLKYLLSYIASNKIKFVKEKEL